MFQNDKQEIFNHKHKGNNGRRMGFILLICKLMHFIVCSLYLFFLLHRMNAIYASWMANLKSGGRAKWNEIRYSIFTFIKNECTRYWHQCLLLPPPPFFSMIIIIIIINIILYYPFLHSSHSMSHSFLGFCSLSPFNSNNVQMANGWWCVSIHFIW